MRSPAESKSAGLAWLALALALYLALRGWMLAVAFDGTALTMYELYPMGTIPKVLPAGHSLPLRDYYDNAAGQLLTGLLAIPSYAAFGSSYLALKLVPLTLGALALIAVFAFARSVFGARAAALCALCFAVGTTTSVKYSLIASGNHFENVFFSSFALYAFFRAHRDGASKASLWLAGFSAGFSIFVFLGALIPVALLALVHLGLRGWRRALADALHLAPAFALGVAPLVLLNLGHDSRGAEFLGTRFGVEEAQAASGPLARLVKFYGPYLYSAPCFDEWLGIRGGVADALYLAASALAWLALAPFAWRGARRLARGALAREGAGELDAVARREVALVPLVAYLPACSLAFAISNLRIGGYAHPLEVAGYRYFLLHFAYVTVLVGAWFAIASAEPVSRARRALAWSIALAVLAAGAFNLGTLRVAASPADAGCKYAGCEYAYLPRGLLGRKNELTQRQVIEFVSRVPSAHRARVYWGIGYYKAFEQAARSKGDESKFDLHAVLDGWPEPYVDDVARGIGTYLRPRGGELIEHGQRVQRLLLGWLDSGEPQAAHVVEGLCLPWEYLLTGDVKRVLDEDQRMLAYCDAKLRDGISRGVGLLMGRLLARGIESDRELVRANLASIDGVFYPELCWGLGFALSDDRERPALDPLVATLDAQTFRPQAWKGFGAGLAHLYSENERDAVFQSLRGSLPPELEKRLGPR